MKKPPMPQPVQLPYASNVASYFGDQGTVTGNSFLGRMFKGGNRTTTINPGSVTPTAAKAVGSAPIASMGGGGFSNSAVRVR